MTFAEFGPEYGDSCRDGMLARLGQVEKAVAHLTEMGLSPWRVEIEDGNPIIWVQPNDRFDERLAVYKGAPPSRLRIRVAFVCGCQVQWLIVQGHGPASRH